MNEQSFPYGEARKELEDVSKAFCQNAVEITSVFNSPITQQYLKAVLVNMENAHKSVQEKATLIVVAVLGTFTTACAFAYLAIGTSNGALRMLLLLVSVLICAFGIGSARALNRVLRATYEFYIASVVHAKVVFGPAKLHHPWTSQVDRALRQVDTIYRFDTATEIRTKWAPKLGWRAKLVELGASQPNYEAEEGRKWSSRIIEAWMAQPGTVLESYQKLLGASVLTHGIFIVALAGAAIWSPLRAEFLPHGVVAPTSSRAASNVDTAASLLSVSSNLSLLNLQVLALTTNLQNILGP